MHIKCLTQYLAHSKQPITVSYYYLGCYIEFWYNSDIVGRPPDNQNLWWDRDFGIIFNKIAEGTALVPRNRGDFVSLKIPVEFSCGSRGQTKTKCSSFSNLSQNKDDISLIQAEKSDNVSCPIIKKSCEIVNF